MENNPPSHTDFVHEIALSLFESTRPFHGLGDSSSILLEIAATHDNQLVPPKIKDPLKASIELASSLPDQINPAVNQKVLGAVFIFQYGQLKEKTVKKLDLSPIEQREALTLAALLRIASGLNASKSQTSSIQQIEGSKEKIWVVIGGPNALQDSRAAQHNARLWKRIGYPSMRLLDADEARTKIMPYPEPSEMIGVMASDPLSEAGRKVMRFHFAQMLKHEAGTRLGEDIEALHDMRVATRRMRAAFTVFGDAFEGEALKPHLAGLRATGRVLGKTRDLDVLLQNARVFRETLTEDQRGDFQALLSDWESQRENARLEMIEFLDSEKYLSFKRKFNVFTSTPGAHAKIQPVDPPIPTKVRELAPVLIYQRLAAVRAYETIVDSASIEQLHALRIEFKGFRYTVEYFREVFAQEEGTIVIDMIKTIQDHLGALNDTQVAAQMINSFLLIVKPDETTNYPQDLKTIEAYLAYQLEEGVRLKANFADIWATFIHPRFRKQIARMLTTL